MTLLTALRRIFRRPEVVEVAPNVKAASAPEPGMVELAQRLAAKRGDNATMNSGDGHDTVMADIAAIYDILKPRIAPEFSNS